MRRHHRCSLGAASMISDIAAAMRRTGPVSVYHSPIAKKTCIMADWL